MNKVLMLGAGLVARPPVRFLLQQPETQVTVASRTVSKAQAIVGDAPNGKAVAWTVDDLDALEKMIGEHDLAISLLPAPQHPVVAKLCIEKRKHMVTTSYVSPAMKELDGPAKNAGVLILNEIGVDPGIDHMSAMKIIHGVKARGGKVVSFKSYCGGLPAPEANTNPWGYKFSWAPRGVLVAGKNDGRYLLDGKEVYVPGPDLFTDVHTLHVDGLGDFEAYPNRDSLGYIDIYGLQGIKTMYRGTLRYAGWCQTWKKMVDLGLLDESETTFGPGATYAAMVRSMVKDSQGNLREDLAKQLGLAADAHVLDWWEWLGLFSDKPLPAEKISPLDALCALFLDKCRYEENERDMIALHHDFRAEYPDRPAEKITSTLIDYGIPGGDSSMSRTVGLPAAIGAKLILDGKIKATGVHIPVSPTIYEPVLAELEKLNIKCVEKTVPA
jgi:saccharopine dehydrogenase (NADP+, L-glutamate forming)/spermidine synthase